MFFSSPGGMNLIRLLRSLSQLIVRSTLISRLNLVELILVKVCGF